MNERSRFIRRRPFTSLLIFVALVLAALVWQYRLQLQAFPDIISAYTAKEYCSCRYVMNNPVEYCQTYVKQWLPSELHDDPARKIVSASGLGRSNSASWEGARQGCRLQATASGY
ncbi:amidase [Pseudomonas huanghezhanensis]|uniref:amidase n=1 Tax=Pseudomonas huanghezhanensis TaxID=3002903 RepID=UPI0022854A11|nr:amidase [Pseudomonas sp. BSw22131]